MNYTTIDSPLGPLRLTSDSVALTGIVMTGHRAVSKIDSVGSKWVRADTTPLFLEAQRQLTAYFAGELREFSLPLAPVGTGFQQRVWAALSQIPYGATVSYGGLAKQIGVPNAARAVGCANGRNPLLIVVPCHRVVGTSGALTGYSGGLTHKETLLALEQNFRR